MMEQHTKRPVTLLASILFCLSLLPVEGKDDSMDIEPSTLHLKVAHATRVTTPPVIDGDLADPVWREAVPITDLVQVEPENLARPTEPTEVRILYDDDNLYVAFRNYDSEPDKITRRLARRDSWSEAAEANSDWVSIVLDSRNDNRTGYSFVVNAAGVKIDSYIFDDDHFDLSWDDVWDAEVKVDNLGWSAEYRLPFFLFQFSSESEQTWGLELNRAIHRKQEFDEWPGKKRGVKGIVSRFGILKEIKNIPPPKQLEILPYGLGGYHLNEKNHLTQGAGVDVEYGLASNTTLNLTFNPDFGQVEADPSVLNLTAFETFFEEKRPFFVEGGSFFKNRIQLFHSRRIGKQPGYFSPDEGGIVQRPDATTILAAAKIMGKSPSGVDFGVIESVTGEEYGVWEHATDEIAYVDSVFSADNLVLDTNHVMVRENFLLEPYANYFVGRLEKPVFNTLSTIGLMVTDIRRREAASASAAGFDWRLRFHDNRLAFGGQAALSRTEDGRGYAGRFYLGYDDPVWWDLRLMGSVYEDAFEINDLGFLKRNGSWIVGVFGGVRKQDPWGNFLRNDLRARLFYRSRNDGLTLSKHLQLDQDNTLKSYWAFGFEGELNFGAFDDEDTFKDSQAWVIARPFEWRASGWIRSDIRKRFVVNPEFSFGRDEIGSRTYMAKLDLTLRPTDYLTLSVDAGGHFADNRVEWVGIDGDSTDDYIVYSSSEKLVRDVRLRLNWTFSPDLSLQVFLQPFKVDMDYYGFKRLKAPETLDFEPYDYGGNPDFRLDNIVGTFVLRWEYSLGSTLFVVFNLNNSSRFLSEENGWLHSKSNTLFIKLNYRFQV